MTPTHKPTFDFHPPDGAHVWTAHLDDATTDELAALVATLDRDELARAARFHFERDRRRFALARGWLRRLLGRYLDLDPAAIRFGYGPRGKPFLLEPGAARLCFNLSHSHGHALFAFSWDREIGIDVEVGARLGDDWPGIARRVFSAREQAELAALPPEIRRDGFLNGWTRKEAYLKAIGLGIVDGLQSIEVTLGPQRPPELLAAPAGMDWTICDLRQIGQPAAALVIGGRQPTQIFYQSCRGGPV